MPKWIEDRAKHIRAKNPDMPESESWAIATQQAHATGHTPKNYGTAEGRHTSKAKYDTPKDDVQTADPGGKSKSAFDVALLAGLADELGAIEHTAAGAAVARRAADFSIQKLAGQGILLGQMKIANLSGITQKLPPNPTSMSDVKSTVPTAPLSGKTPKTSKVNSTPTPSPLAAYQPTSEPPPVRR